MTRIFQEASSEIYLIQPLPENSPGASSKWNNGSVKLIVTTLHKLTQI